MRLSALGMLAGMTGACALTTPDLRSAAETPVQETLKQQQLLSHIQCELAKAVVDAKALVDANPQLSAEDRAAWLKTWGAKVSLVVTVNHNNGFTPGFAITDPLENVVTTFKNGPVTSGQSRSFGFGFTWTAAATRTETMGFEYSFDDLAAAVVDPTKCKSSGFYLSSDLKIPEFLVRGVDLSLQPGLLAAKSNESPFTTFTYQTKFVVTTGGDFTPAWKLVRLSANQSGKLFAASRIRTDDLTITFGKYKLDKDGKPEPSQELRDQHLANLIGQAVANSLQGQSPK